MTISEIAEKAEVSIGTVDRVIHKRGRVSAKTTKKIEDLIAEFGYKPNPIAQHLKNNRKYIIGVLLPKLESESSYWQLLFDGIIKAERELKPFSIYIRLQEFDRTKKGSCERAGKILIKKGIDILVLAPVVPGEACKIIDLLNEIPYVFVDSPLPNTQPLITAAQNPFKAGYCAGHLMHMLHPHATRMICIQMHATAYNLTQRSRGFMAYFARLGHTDINHKVWNWSDNEDDYFKFLDSVFEEYRHIDGFFITNASVYQLGTYIASRKIEKKFAVAGFDLQQQNITGLLDNSIDVIISQQPSVQGYRAVYEIYRKAVLHQEPIQRIEMPIDIYFKENLSEFDMD